MMGLIRFLGLMSWSLCFSGPFLGPLSRAISGITRLSIDSHQLPHLRQRLTGVEKPTLGTIQKLLIVFDLV